jgi:hypothetical protein
MPRENLVIDGEAFVGSRTIPKGVIALAGMFENASCSPTLSYGFGPGIRDNSDSAGTQMTQCAILSGPVMSSALYLSETDII